MYNKHKLIAKKIKMNEKFSVAVQGKISGEVPKGRRKLTLLGDYNEKMPWSK